MLIRLTERARRDGSELKSFDVITDPAGLEVERDGGFWR
jgi:hypothetical protein